MLKSKKQKLNQKIKLRGKSKYNKRILGQQFSRELKDAFKVFRTLCILSMKPIPGTEGYVL
jgi:hypothetical protein